jgi:hypothetical protein
VQKIVQPIGAIASAALTSFVTLYARANRGGAMLLDLLGPPGLAGGAVADFVLVIFRFGATMELGRSERTTMRSNSPYSLLAIHHYRCPFPHARGWAARCRPTCSTCSGRLGGAAAAGRMMVRSPAAPSPVLFSGIVVRRFWFGADDGARAVGATDDDDVGFAGSGWWRRRGATYGVDRSNDGKFSSTDMVLIRSIAAAASAIATMYATA